MIKDLQSLLFSTTPNIQHIQTKIIELKNDLSIKKIDHQIILAFSLNYERIPILSPFLSKPEIEKGEFIHFDQELLFSLLKNNISFPLSIIIDYQYNDDNDIEANDEIRQIIMEKYLYEELKKQNKNRRNN